MDIRWTPKPEATEQLESELARLSKALGHPTRVRILREILTRDDCTCGHLVRILPLAQSTVSQHLKVLRKAAILEVKLTPGRTAYRLNHQTLTRYRRLVATLTG